MPVPSNASGLVFVRRQDFLMHLDEHGQKQYLGYRMKILHPNALQLGNVSLVWNPASGVPQVHAITIHRDGAVTDVLKSASFEILRREDQLEAAKLDGNLTAVLRISDLRVGDELEVALTIPASDPTLGRNDAGLLVLGAAPNPGRYRLRLSWSQGREPLLKMTPDMTAIAERYERAVEFRFDNPAIMSPPKDAPGRFQWQRAVEFSIFSHWNAVSRHFAPLFTEASKVADGSPLKAEAMRIAATHADERARAEAALKLVQQDVRYVYVGLNGGNLIPATAENTWKRRYGDCKGKAALLLGLLAELGIEAEPVLVNNGGTDDGLDERLPNPRMFDHVIVRARIGGANYWLDGTLPPVVSPGLTPALPYRWVLVLTPHGNPLESLEWRPAKRPDEIMLHEIDSRAGFDQPARVTNTTIVRGIAGLQQYIELDDVKWRYDQKAEASVLTITGTWKIDWDDDGDGARSFALPGGGFYSPERRVRPADQKQDVPFFSKSAFQCHVTTVKIPDATKMPNWSTKGGFDTRIFGKNYYRAFEIRENAIRMVRGLRVERQEIGATSAQKDNERLASFNNSMAWVYYDPAGKRSSGRSGSSVPATYEIDWTADTVPCLAPDVIP